MSWLRPAAPTRALAGLCFAAAVLSLSAAERRPSIVFLIADQWRAQACGFAGDPNAKTPHLDRLASEAVWFDHAVSGVPVCCPARASLLTGQRPLRHGVFLNDVPLDPSAITIAKVLKAAEYDTGYIGKWHLNGAGRSAYIPPERRQGFDYWKALECTHDYTNSAYFADGPEQLKWPGYDAFAQTDDACEFIQRHAQSDKPFLLFLAWGPPHDPYASAPASYRARYSADNLQLRPNVTAAVEKQTRTFLAGYYAHCAALDDCVGKVLAVLKDAGLAENTILIFTSDHGDMLGSHGLFKKQKPYDESIRIPFLLRWPHGLGATARRLDALITFEDVTPTLLGLCHVPIPTTVEGLDYSGLLRGGRDPSEGAALIACVAPFGEWEPRNGGREYRGVRTERYSYVRDLRGPWLLFDNQVDPFQTNNLVNLNTHAALQSRLEGVLRQKLRATGDDFRPGSEYIAQWHYTVDANGTVPYTR